MTRFRERPAAVLQAQAQRMQTQRAAASSVAAASVAAKAEDDIADVAAGIPADLSSTLADLETRVAGLEAA